MKKNTLPISISFISISITFVISLLSKYGLYNIFSDGNLGFFYRDSGKEYLCLLLPMYCLIIPIVDIELRSHFWTKFSIILLSSTIIIDISIIEILT